MHGNFFFFDDVQCCSQDEKKEDPKSVMAGIIHFKSYITKGILASLAECKQCKNAEDPALETV